MNMKVVIQREKNSNHSITDCFIFLPFSLQNTKREGRVWGHGTYSYRTKTDGWKWKVY